MPSGHLPTGTLGTDPQAGWVVGPQLRDQPAVWLLLAECSEMLCSSLGNHRRASTPCQQTPAGHSEA